VGEQGRRPRAQPPRGRHYLAPRFAAELVRSFDIARHELVVEIGAGTGRLTRELVRAAEVVVAIEVDPILAKGIVGADWARPNLLVHRGDALEAVLPPSPFRVVGNVPFGISTALLRRFLEDERTTRADLIVQLELARKHAASRGHVLSVLWSTVWHLHVRQRIPANRFHPAPQVDAAWLSAVRRSPPLIGRDERREFERLVRHGFRQATLPLRTSLGVSRPTLRKACGDADARAVDLDAKAWSRLFRAMER
jgi:23S rRNA (adenine-N6)-dimethyltransferase